LKKAAKHRHCDAMHTLAWLLIQQDEHKEALRVLYNAAKEGHEESSEAVATMYQRGIGVVPNRKKSASWFEIGSEQRQTGLKAETMLWRLGHPSFYPSALV
jgi:TPR repeat protein